MKAVKVLVASALIFAAGAAAAQGYYHRPPPVVNYNYTNIYRPPVPYYPPAVTYSQPSFKYEHLYGAAIVGAVTGAILENASRPQQPPPVVVQQPPVVVTAPAREPVVVSREEWIYDPACDCKRRQVFRQVY